MIVYYIKHVLFEVKVASNIEYYRILYINNYN